VATGRNCDAEIRTFVSPGVASRNDLVISALRNVGRWARSLHLPLPEVCPQAILPFPLRVAYLTPFLVFERRCVAV